MQLLRNILPKSSLRGPRNRCHSEGPEDATPVIPGCPSHKGRAPQHLLRGCGPFPESWWVGQETCINPVTTFPVIKSWVAGGLGVLAHACKPFHLAEEPAAGREGKLGPLMCKPRRSPGLRIPGATPSARAHWGRGPPPPRLLQEQTV